MNRLMRLGQAAELIQGKAENHWDEVFPASVINFHNFDQVDMVLVVSGTRFSSRDQKPLFACLVAAVTFTAGMLAGFVRTNARPGCLLIQLCVTTIILKPG